MQKCKIINNVAVIVLFIAPFPLSLYGMKGEPKTNTKGYALQCTVTLPINSLGNPHEADLKKKVMISAPDGLSKTKAETYLRKQGKKLQNSLVPFIPLCVSLIYDSESGVVVNTDLYNLVHNPESLFEYREHSTSLYIQRPLGGDPKQWYFTEIMEIILKDQKGSCGPCAVQLHNDQRGAHDKVLICELERLYKESNAPQLLVQGETELLTESALVVESRDDKLKVLANFFLQVDTRYKQLVLPKK